MERIVDMTDGGDIGTYFGLIDPPQVPLRTPETSASVRRYAMMALK